MSYDCFECEELPSEARAVRDLYTTKEYFRENYFKLCEEYDKLEAELKQLRNKYNQLEARSNFLSSIKEVHTP